MLSYKSVFIILWACLWQTHENEISTATKQIRLIFYHLPPHQAQSELQRYQRKRDFYRLSLNTTESYVTLPILNFYKILADRCNASLDLVSDAGSENVQNSRNVSEIYPISSSYLGSIHHISTVWQKYRNQSRDVNVLQTFSLEYNFIYCDIPKYKNVQPWDFTNLTSSFSKVAWLLIATVVLIISLILRLSISESKAKFKFEMYPIVVSSIFPSNPSCHNELRKSMLFTLWSYCVLLISNLYSGTITSGLISPLEEDSHSSFSDLANNNFSILFTGEDIINVLNATVLHYNEQKYMMSSSKYQRVDDIEATEKLLQNSNLNNQDYSRVEKQMWKLILCRGTTIIEYWPVVLSLLDYINNAFLKSPEYKQKAEPSVNCYLGKRLVPGGSIFQIFASPDENVLRKLTMTLTETGIYIWWYEEMIGIFTSIRVQDRKKFVGPTVLKNDWSELSHATPLTMKGKVSCVFFYLGIALFVAGFVFIYERWCCFRRLSE